jgi:pimeloyl-ACP methyl ester carboxylesterase
VPSIYLNTSQLVPNVSPVRIYYREGGEGAPLVFLHGGWGYEFYPFDHQIGALRSDWKLIAPDRGGYGRSTHIDAELPPDFHLRAVSETLGFLNALHIERTFLWGHSDGAVIAAMMGLVAPDRVIGLILEAFHYYRVKSHSRKFYETQAYDTERLGPTLCEKFALEHGRDWKKIISNGGKAWLRIADESPAFNDDLYGGALKNLSVPAIVIHGELDPRTEPDELADVRRNIPSCEMHVLKGAYHSPHSESITAHETTELARTFLSRMAAT